MPDYPYDLFLSYAQADAPWVRSYFTPALGLPAGRIVQASDFRPGVSLFDELERAVKSSRYTLLILSPAFLADQWASLGEQLAAYLGAAGQAERIIPLVLHPCELPLRIEFRVRLDCTDQDEWDNQVGRLRGLFDLPDPGADVIECPYPGMVPFTADRANAFYGREDEIEFMLQHLRHQKFLLVVGASGSGKSSVITAGLLPKLEPSGYFQKRPWLVVGPIRPAAAPWQSLAQALGGDPGDINAAVNGLLASYPAAGRVLLVVDQFEELFTQGSREEQRRFIAALKRLREHDAAAVIIAMRADFYADLLKSDLWPIDPSQRLDVGPLKGDALRRAIEQPAADQGVYIEARLVDRLIADASDAPGALPLLQETLLQLWGRRLRRFLPYSAYAELGGGKGNGLAAAIAQKADATLAQLSDGAVVGVATGGEARGDRDIAQRIFLRLVQFGEGRADTRRQQPIAALRSAGDFPARFDFTLGYLSDNRLIALSGDDEQDSERKADIAHEALFQGWPTLTNWIGQYRDAELLRRSLDARAAEWVANTRANERLLNRVQLTQAADWLAKPDSQAVGYSAELTELVAASRRYQDRARLIRFATTAALVLFAVLAILFWGLGQQANAEFQAQQSALQASARETAEAGRLAELAARQTAEANRTLALRNESEAWALLAGQSLATDPVASLWWSSRALPSPDNERPAVPQAEYELRLALQQSLERAYADVGAGVTAAQVDAGGPALAVGGANLVYWPHDLGAPLKQLPGPVAGLGWHTDGALFAYTGGALTVWRNDVAFRHDLGNRVVAAAWRPARPELAVISGQRLSLWPYQVGEPQVLGTLPSHVEVRGRQPPLAWSPDGASLAAWDRGGDLLLYGDPPGDPPTVTLKLPAAVAGAAWSVDSRTLVALLDDGAGLAFSGDMALAAAKPFTAAVFAEVNPSGAPQAFGGLVFLDADRFITWGLGAAPKLWSLNDLSAAQRTYRLQVGTVAGVSVSPDAARFTAFGESGDFDVFRIDDEGPLHLQGHSRGVAVAAWNGDFLATGGSDGTVRLWDLRDGAERPELVSLVATRGAATLGRSYVAALEWRGGDRLLAVAEDGSARIWQVLDGDREPLCSGRPSGSSEPIACAADSRGLRGHEARLASLRWLDAGVILSADGDGAARRWELNSAETRLVPGDSDSPRRALWSPDGARVFTYPDGPDGPGDAAIWDVRTGQPAATVKGPVEWASWSALGLLVGRSSAGLAWVDPATGANAAELKAGPHADLIEAAALSGPRLALATRTGEIYVWRDVAARPFILARSDADPIAHLAWSPDGARLVSAGSLIQMWDVAAGVGLWTSAASGLSSCAPAFSPDGAQVAGCIDSRFYVWDAAKGTSVTFPPAGTQTAKGVAWRTAPGFDGKASRLLLLVWAGDTAEMWDWDQRARVAAYRELPELNLAAISPDGHWLGTANDAGGIRLWNLSLGDPQSLLRSATDRITRKLDQ